MSVKLRWLGHSCFRVERGDFSIVLDPFAPNSVPGCADIRETADLVLCSHDHGDHNYRDGVRLKEPAGENPFTVTQLSSYHDDRNGALRGKNTITVLEAEGLKLVHFGDIGCMPGPMALEKLRGADVILLPVGGYYTVGPKEAKAIVDAVKPRAVIPMHYRSDSFGYDVIGPVEDFLALCAESRIVPSDTVEITAGSGGITLTAAGQDVTPKALGGVVALTYGAKQEARA